MPDSSTWRRLLNLGERLIALPTVAAQRNLIVETAVQMVGGQVDLWLNEALCRQPGLEQPFPCPPEPSSDLMCRVLDRVGRVSAPVLPTAKGSKAAPSTTKGSKAAPSSSALYSEGVVTSGSAIALPLLAQGRIVGVLEMRRPAGLSFNREQIDLLSGLAAQSAVALQAARQVAIERWRLEQLSLVRQVSAQVASVFDVDELARRVTRLVLDSFSYYYVALFVLDPGQEILQMRASAGRPGRSESLPTVQVRLGQGIVGCVARDGEEILANDVGREPRYRYVDALPETRSEVALPLRIGDRVLGVLDVQSDRRHAFDETDLLTLRALADQIAISVEDARLYSNLQRRAVQLSAVAKVSRAVASVLDLDVLFNEVVKLIHEQFGYPCVNVFTVDPAQRQVVYRAGVSSLSHDEGAGGGWVAADVDECEGIVPWVARHGETTLINDVGRDSRYSPSPYECEPRSRVNESPPGSGGDSSGSPSGPPSAGARSLSAQPQAVLAVPLTFGSKVLGVLEVQSSEAFNEQDRALFEALADSVAIAIRNANLYRSERWRRQVADSLREVASLLSQDVALDHVLDAVLAELEQTLPCDVAAIWLLHDDDLRLDAVQAYAEDVNVSQVEAVGDFSPGIASWLTRALSAECPVIRSPDSPAEPLGIALGFPSDYSAIAAPLRAGGQSLGLLALAHRAPGRYGAESRAMTAAFASYAAVAIENARLYQQAQEQARISTVMLQVARATRSLTTLDQVLETVIQLVPTLVDVDRCAILLRHHANSGDSISAVFLPAAACGLDSTQQETFERWRVELGDEPAFDDLCQSKAPVFIYDVATDPRLSGLVIWALGFESLLLLPLLAQDEVVGALLIEYQSDWFESGAVGAFHDERLAIIQGVALQTAVAVENVRLREAQQEEAYVSTALLQVAQAVANLNDLDDILGTIVRIVPILVGVERCILFLWDDGKSAFRPVQAYGVPRDGEARLLSHSYAPGDFPLLDAVRERNDLVVCAPSDSPETGEAGTEGRVTSLLAPDFVACLATGPDPVPSAHRSWLAVPLSIKDDVLGVLGLEEADVPSRSRARRMEIITGVARQAALAVQNDRFQRERAEHERLERELQLAHEIQQTFMPDRWPDLSGWELAFTWRAARQVAGDFYDFFELPGGRLGLVIADVADKGMPAALFMALTRTLIRAAALEETSPAVTLAHVNDLLVPDARQGMFVTAVYAILSLRTEELIYANAGHNLPLLLRSRSQELERLPKGGMALGVLAGVDFEEHTVHLGLGDCVIFYTDGITEAFSPRDEMYGEKRLWLTIQEADETSAQMLLDAIDEAVTAFVGDGVLSDDRTLMVLRRK